MQKTILVIEDEQELLNLLEEELTLEGYKVHTARNGEEGLDRLQEIEPDLIICDRAMPVMSGFELLERMRGIYPQYNNLPFVFLTALSDARDKYSVTHLNPSAYIEKPVDFKNLIETVQSFIGPGKK